MSKKHYEGPIGIFDYDDKEWEILTENAIEGPYLHYKGDGNNVKLPEGCISCFKMFEDYVKITKNVIAKEILCVHLNWKKKLTLF